MSEPVRQFMDQDAEARAVESGADPADALELGRLPRRRKANDPERLAEAFDQAMHNAEAHLKAAEAALTEGLMDAYHAELYLAEGWSRFAAVAKP